MTVTVVKGEFLAEDLNALKDWFKQLEDSGIHFFGSIESYNVKDA